MKKVEEQMKRIFFVIISYLVAGVGLYHSFFGAKNMYGYIILGIGLFGIIVDLFSKRLNID